MNSINETMAPPRWALGLLTSSLIWGAGTALGIQAVPGASLPTDAFQADPTAALPEHSSGPAPTDQLDLYVGILGRNLAVYLWLLCGLISGGMTTLAVLFFNGTLLGYTLSAGIGIGMPPARLAWLLLPHGVPEISTFLLAGAIGLQGPRLLAAWTTGTFRPAALRGLSKPAGFGCLILAAAAAIEVGFTVPLANWATQL